MNYFTTLSSIIIKSVVTNPIVYKIYEKILWNQIKDGKKPEHIGIILDGNRRWALKHSKQPSIGHEYGANKIEDLLEWCLELEVKTITLYVFSTENFSRPSQEIKLIMRLLEENLQRVFNDDHIHKNRIKIKAIGRINLLPESLQKLIIRVEERTRNYDNYYLNVAIAYGGRAEIIDATKKIIKNVLKGKLNINDINEKTIEKHLYTAHLPKSDPDLIIRTSGEERLSGFLLWQGAYSELYFLDVFWPDFRRIDLLRAIRTYQQRTRRFGK